MTTQIVFLNGRFIDKEEARISPDDRGFLFADGVYEVILSFNGRLFEPQAHFKRLKRSLTALRIPEPPDVDALEGVGGRLLEENGLMDGGATVYIQITRGEAPRKHAFPDATVPRTVYAAASRFTPLDTEWRSGASVITVPDNRWLRCDIKALALIPNVMACQEATEKGATEAIFVRDGVVTEGTLTSFAAVFDGTLHTHPANHLILPGVTREVVLSLCREMEIPAKETPIPAADLEVAEECMLLGTTKEVMPVVKIDGRPVADGTPGPVTRRLRQALRNRIRGIH